jgi:hypothetical protein
MQSSAHVFISFKTQELEFASLLRTALVNSGYKVWWQKEIQCGQEWHGEIDKSIEEAGAIVVLWSKKSMTSPWVRHEASQAIAKGVYTPVRIEVMDIDSPYNRIQATDMINWSGGVNHPGFQNLLIRLKELLPEPIPFWRQSVNFIWKQRAVITSSIIAAIALFLLFRQSTVLDEQIRKQEELLSNVNRAVQPIQNLTVSVFIDIDNSTPGLEQYLSELRSTLLNPKHSDYWETTGMKGTTVVSSNSNLAEEVVLTKESEYWPSDNLVDINTCFGSVIQAVNLSLEFNAPESPKENYYNSNPYKADLVMSVGSEDPDGSEDHKKLPELRWDLVNNKLQLVFWDTPSPNYWQSNGKIVSVPYIDKAIFSARMLTNGEGKLFPNDSIVCNDVLLISSIFINFSGRELHFKGNDMKKELDNKGHYVYTAPAIKGYPNNSPKDLLTK